MVNTTQRKDTIAAVVQIKSKDWFSDQAQIDQVVERGHRAVSLGCWFSIGPAMLRSNRGRELASAMPLDRVLTETDAPFTRDGDDPLMPWQAYDCLAGLEEVRGIDRIELGKLVADRGI